MLILRSVGSKEAILAQNGDGSIEVIGNDPTMLQAAIGSPTNRRGSFEIVCFKDGQEKFQVLFSKLEKGAFPDYDEVAGAVKAFYASGEVKEITKTQSSCAIS
jgi:hypothetical protein